MCAIRADHVLGPDNALQPFFFARAMCELDRDGIFSHLSDLKALEFQPIVRPYACGCICHHFREIIQHTGLAGRNVGVFAHTVRILVQSRDARDDMHDPLGWAAKTPFP